ncbi:MAG: lysophospholipid acyltransferase family protein [Brachybacterium sp.]|nr:lysophospholipid acyltransferase family protein [Brachybacterium sp.]
MPTFYSTVRGLLRPAIMTIWRPRVTGLENIPQDGAFIVAANHLANLDSFLIPIVAPRQVRFITKDTYWKKRGPIGWVQKRFFTAVGAVPVDRETLSAAQGALDVALSVLQQGDGFGIYPEGTRSRDGRLHKGRPGVAWLAMQSGAPVIPVGLKGTQEVFRPGSRIPRIVPITMRFGAPVDFSDIDESAPQGARRRAMTARVMDRIADLSGQERADTLNAPPPSKDPRG